MDIYFIVLRLTHVLTTAIWAGFVIMLALYINPAVSSLGPEGGKFMQALGRTRNFPVFMSSLGGLAILSGILMYLKISGPGFIQSRYGLILTIGAVCGLISFIIGSAVNGPTIKKLTRLGNAIASSGTAPNKEQLDEIARFRNKLISATKFLAFMLFLALMFMASAKYI